MTQSSGSSASALRAGARRAGANSYLETPVLLETQFAGSTFPVAEFLRDARHCSLTTYRVRIPRAAVAPREATIANALDAGEATVAVSGRGVGVLAPAARVTAVYVANEGEWLTVDAEAIAHDAPVRRRARVLHT